MENRPSNPHPMPTLYTYKGVKLSLTDDRRDPMHFMATAAYGESAGVRMWIRDGKVYLVNYTSSTLSTENEQSLRELVNAKKEDIRKRWIDHFINHLYVQPINVEQL